MFLVNRSRRVLRTQDNFKMLDLQTYRLRIGAAPSLVNKIIQRKTKFRQPEEWQDDLTKEDIFTKTFRNLNAKNCVKILVTVIFVVFWVQNSHESFASPCKVLWKSSQLQRATSVVADFSHQPHLSWDPVIGAVHFISLLLLMAGVEPNPGPLFKDEQQRYFPIVFL